MSFFSKLFKSKKKEEPTEPVAETAPEPVAETTPEPVSETAPTPAPISAIPKADKSYFERNQANWEIIKRQRQKVLKNKEARLNRDTKSRKLAYAHTPHHRGN
jgi:hypothetical protein